MLCQMLHNVWSAPVRIIIALVLLYQFVGWAAVGGAAVMAAGSPIQTKLVKMQEARRKTISKLTDNRLSLTNELLNGMRVVKFYAWEAAFMEKISQVQLLYLSTNI